MMRESKEPRLYRLGKKAISQYVQTGCRLRLRFEMHAGDVSRSHAGIPPKDGRNPGLLVSHGRAHERAAFKELYDVFPGRVFFGPEVVEADDERAFQKIALGDYLPTAEPGDFIVEGEFEVCAGFRRAHGLRDLETGEATAGGGRMTYSKVRPDIVRVEACGAGERRAIRADGEIRTVPAEDARHGLRIVDVKLASEPGPAHFAELAYYAMTLDAWLAQAGLDDRFLVLADAGIWPGNHEGSALKALLDAASGGPLDQEAASDAWLSSLEILPAEVVTERVKRFLAVELREVVSETDWRALPWHVGRSCSGCDWLGFTWGRDDPDDPAPSPPGDALETGREDYCWNRAAREGHLSRIPGMTAGACGKLARRGIRDLAAFAALPPDDPAYEEHQALKAGRAILRHRAEALAQGRTIGVPDRAGTSAVLPKWADARVAFSVDYDVASGLTFAFGYKLLILSGGVAAETREAVEIVGSKSVAEERRVFAALMARLQTDLLDAERIILEGRERALGRAAKERAKRQPPTVQFYIWDRNSFEHLSRLMGRHLEAVREPDAEGVTASPMSWIFPAAQLLKDARNISRNSPVTIVAEAVRLLAVDIPHHYSILEVAARYQMVGIVKLAKATRRFPVSNLFKDPLSDQVPSERGLEVWSGSRLVETMGRDAHAGKLRQTVAIKLDAMLSIVRRLTDDLDETLSSHAPTIRSIMHDQARLDGVSDDGQILRQHARLMKAAEALDVDLAMAMPPQEREARYRSMRLLRRLSAEEAAEFLVGAGVAPAPRIHVFEFRASSLEAKIKVGDFNLSLMPEDSLRLQHATLRMLKRDHPELSKRIKDDFVRDSRRIRENCPVTVLALDRIARLVAVEDDEGLPTLFHELGIWSLDFDGAAGPGGILDPISRDFFVAPRLEPALRSYGVPPLSVSRPLFARGVSNVALRRSARSGGSVPAERFVWDADRLAEEPSGRSGAEALAVLERIGRSLTPRQADAVSRAVGRRLSLLWGPPGTGKSRTAVSLLIALLAVSRGRKLRIAVTGPTWVAIENVAAELPEAFAKAGIGPVRHVRLASSRASAAGVHENLRGHILAPSGAKDDKATKDLLGVLQARSEHVVLSGTAEQLARLVKIASEDKEAPRAPLVDFMLVDEASQMDVAHAVVAFTALAEDACLTVVGDDLQMPPIHPVEPPEGGAHLVGSVYDFYRLYRSGHPGGGIGPTMLDVNYRSNAEIVDFFRNAGYGRDLRAAHPGLRIDLRPPATAESAPSRALEAILDPGEPLVAIVHEDVFSSQRNEAEADLVSAMVAALYGRLGSLERTGEILDEAAFFREGVGVVTPHRAQQAAILERLGARLPPEVDRESMTAAVDTVERFQGQQKAVMVASFGIGDADQIAAEEEFLFGLNRFNVIASRARAKLVVVMSRSLADHLPRDLAVLRGSRLLKGFVGRHLPSVAYARIPGLGRCEIRRAGPKPHPEFVHPAPAVAAE